MKKYIHVNQHNIKSNRKYGENKPVFTVKTYKSNDYGHEVHIDGPCTIVYSPVKPLSCGAHVWIQTEAEVHIKEERELDIGTIVDVTSKR